MKKIFRLSSVCALALCAGVSSAAADVAMWRDVGSKMSLTYDDRWDAVSNQNPGDVLTIRAPNTAAHGLYNFAGCKVNIENDGRFKIYPRRNAGTIQRTAFSRDYWERYFGLYNDVVVHEGTDNNGLGEGFASMASFSFEDYKGAKVKKRGIAFASHYRNRVYLVECSAEESVYHEWHNAFLNVIKSVDFHDGTNFAITGYYRDFLQDKTLKVRGPSVFEDGYY
ncbi:MAG TPA: hypothetical protein PK513_08945 [Alphaproteobacteria bacterium]|nr:hypothetical protein [Alphaproteobacteria bacterium]USO05995.1 MAG: hypothetical protein H6859_01960 [Rhodospirillales bacterium]HOO82617.1 hypothetical protein [Alphaproteobacteria bacterium]